MAPRRLRAVLPVLLVIASLAVACGPQPLTVTHQPATLRLVALSLIHI